MLTSSAFPSGMNKTADQMRDRELMAFNVDNVQKLVISHDDGSEVAIDRDGDKWKIVKPASYAADPTQVRQVLTTLGDSKVADFITDTPSNAAQYGLKNRISRPRFTSLKAVRRNLCCSVSSRRNPARTEFTCDAASVRPSTPSRHG